MVLYTGGADGKVQRWRVLDGDINPDNLAGRQGFKGALLGKEALTKLGSRCRRRLTTARFLV